MPRHSYEWKLEDFAIRSAMFSNILPPEFPLLHHDDREQAEQERIIFTATTGDEEPAGSGVYTTELLIEFRSTNRNAQETDDIFAALIASFVVPGALVYGAQLFPGGLWMDQEEGTDARSDGRDTRTRSRTIPFSVAHVSATE